VPYDHTRDFFFSGHCGGLSIVTAEMFHLQLTKTGVLALLSLLYMANMLLTTEVHYSIDILAGILFALWFYRLAIRYVVYFDKLFSLPQVGWNKLLELLRKEEDEGSATSVTVVLPRAKTRRRSWNRTSSSRRKPPSTRTPSTKRSRPDS
jgi:hypothetical protein